MTNDEFLKSITLEGEIWKDITGYEALFLVYKFFDFIKVLVNVFPLV